MAAPGGPVVTSAVAEQGELGVGREENPVSLGLAPLGVITELAVPAAEMVPAFPGSEATRGPDDAPAKSFSGKRASFPTATKASVAEEVGATSAAKQECPEAAFRRRSGGGVEQEGEVVAAPGTGLRVSYLRQACDRATAR